MSACESPRDVKNRSDKDCCCGGHNQKNHKKNRRHHSTANRLSIRMARKITRMSFDELRDMSVNPSRKIIKLAKELTEGVEI